ncbi:50S ribosomal protein L25/general stress protein Ctc [Falsarthrobacter nasiphocae]|uniref:Large ribosomal subunit protein bL25 n=1 Tax=Falsarthrobacter nasiphocae TaxID=189863 RepID=A0AAE3YE82_9MICC|nr:50S ribosomal protein L25/general stress protein Ctc [Falsarthrobacter nasiphocae]MDR6891585.1 large subunit ribosomal protein L25 [Falsarthrobacter nasiphocae]
MATTLIQGQLRTEFGKGAARQARRDGKVPAVIYGHGAEPIHVLLPQHEIELAVRTANALLDVKVDSESHLALVKDVQRDIIRQSVDHLDLLTVRRGEKVEVEVNVQVEGEATPGAVVNLETATILVEAEATHLPDSITFSVEGREIGEHVYVSDLDVPSGVTLLTDAETVVITISEPPVIDLGEEDEAAEDEAAEGEESGEGQSEAPSEDSSADSE